ncbi:transketolase [Candidatus Pantoea edessiphila]|uniref:Transketolase n=1 Tax=Candidatus Pantoea edessiphila TaxID=2044610 RepID=A0A2P5SXN7_9GAMM|nr:transketolase [Candidatus Pantoea edessiphila]MBK4775708.1 transketolase [Pantoea sp. Edef]PPI87062.1 transketolase [Candidatus Pantoea edessiphila]
MPSHKELANAIRVLSMDAVQKANSGHPGAPMGMADIAEVLWRKYLKHNPNNPFWFNRDRFVLSNGHGSMLIYSLLHLTGYDLSINELKNFRQLHSKTPGHPEYRHTIGVETTTGPLGQGLANAIGFAIAEKILSSQFNRPNYNIVDHNTYVFVGDGCMMEGISHEVCSLAGTLRLGKLIVFYDDNGISIDGHTEYWFTDNTAKRFEAYNWHVIKKIDGHDATEIIKAIEQAKIINNQPSLLIFKTIIGYGSPNKGGTHNSHGAPLGENEVMLTRKYLNWKHPQFVIPQEIYDAWNSRIRGQNLEIEWKETLNSYSKKYPELAAEFQRRIHEILPDNWNNITKTFIKNLQENPENIAGRKSSQNTIEILGNILPELLGGSADLTPSNLTMWSGSNPINKNFDGNYIHYGVREFGMTAIANGIAIHGGFLPYTATFLMFSEYAHNAIRMAALMKIRHIMIYTHDSIGVGEDGPTHQPIEQISNLRTIPNMNLWRPCDQVECAIAWKCSVERKDGPSILVLSRQNLVQQNRTSDQIKNVERGGYILKDCLTKKPDLILIATGSEVELAVAAYNKLSDDGCKVRVVSIPSTNVFDRQIESYRESVLPSKIKIRIAIEAGKTDFWFRYVDTNGKIIGINSFGMSGTTDKLFNFFGFTVDNIISTAKSLLSK